MDWSKAKNILIIAFIITNIFLGLSIFKNMKQYNYFYSVNGQRIKDVISILEEKDIIVKTDVPKDVPKLPALTVKYETYNGNEMAEKFLETYIEKDKEYVKGNESVKVTFNNKLLIYERKPEIFSLKDISQEQAKKIADSFIEKYGFSGKNVEHWSTTKEQYDEYKIIYKQKYNDMFLLE
jgi:regulatory protein YycI of two-component signal transduction system YycFG